ncbi:hypothetical protein LUZ60_016664 [Juncus effusus]|nr:hypothetical protein LUZ60_016664 [Juncus effusus]
MADMQIVMVSGKTVEPQFVDMRVPLYSFGCEKKIKKALSRLKGIHSINVDYPNQKVTVWGICNKDDVLEAIRRKRRIACFWDESELHIPSMPAHEDYAPAKSSRLAVLRICKFRKSWKKLFPLTMY